MEENVKYGFLMSQLTHIQDVKETEKTKLSIVFYQQKQIACILRVCKNRDLSDVCGALCRNRNPNAAVIYDYVYANGNTYILEEKLNGVSLAERLEADKCFSEKETAQIIIKVCNALELLHAEQPPVVHNDINPSNIMICEDGQIKLFDFDISRVYKKGNSRNTMLFGTEEYASPEHFGYGQSEPRTDIYCLGVTMHTMLTGTPLNEEHKITYSGELKAILQKCLEVDPDNRYASVTVLKKALERYLSKRRGFWCWLGLAAAGVAIIAALLAMRSCGTVNRGEETTITPALQSEQQITEPTEMTTLPEKEQVQTEETTQPSQEQSNVIPGVEKPQTETNTPTGQQPQTGTITPTVQQPQTGGATTGGTTTEVKPPQTETDTPTVQRPHGGTNVGNNTEENATLFEIGQMCSEYFGEGEMEKYYRFHTGDTRMQYKIWIDSLMMESMQVTFYGGDIVEYEEEWWFLYKFGGGDGYTYLTLEADTDYYIHINIGIPSNDGVGGFFFKVEPHDGNETEESLIIQIQLGQERRFYPHDGQPLRYKLAVEQGAEYEVYLKDNDDGEDPITVSITGAIDSNFSQVINDGECITRTVTAASDGWFYISVTSEDYDDVGWCILKITKK